LRKKKKTGHRITKGGMPGGKKAKLHSTADLKPEERGENAYHKMPRKKKKNAKGQAAGGEKNNEPSMRGGEFGGSGRRKSSI